MKTIDFMNAMKTLSISKIFHVSTTKYFPGDILENVEFRCFHGIYDNFELYIYNIVPENDAEIEITSSCKGKISKCCVKRVELPSLTNLATSPTCYDGKYMNEYMNEYMNYFSLKLYQSSGNDNIFHTCEIGNFKMGISDYRIFNFSDDCCVVYYGKGKFGVDGKVDLFHCPIPFKHLGKTKGWKFNEICKKYQIKLFKTLSSSLIHNGLKFEENLLIQDEDKGIYFCDEENLKRWSHYGGEYRYLIADVVIPDDAIVKISSNRFSTNKIILQNIRENLPENIEFHRQYIR